MKSGPETGGMQHTWVDTVLWCTAALVAVGLAIYGALKLAASVWNVIR